jgi:hypothetical protein
VDESTAQRNGGQYAKHCAGNQRGHPEAGGDRAKRRCTSNSRPSFARVHFCRGVAWAGVGYLRCWGTSVLVRPGSCSTKSRACPCTPHGAQGTGRGRLEAEFMPVDLPVRPLPMPPTKHMLAWACHPNREAGGAIRERPNIDLDSKRRSCTSVGWWVWMAPLGYGAGGGCCFASSEATVSSD